MSCVVLKSVGRGGESAVGDNMYLCLLAFDRTGVQLDE